MRTLFLFLLLLLPFECAAEVKLIEIKHRAAVDLVAQVRELLDAGEKAQAAGNHLILIADGETLLAAEKLVALLDRPLVNLLIRVKQSEELQQVGKESTASLYYGNQGGLSTSAGVGFRRGNSTTRQEQSLQLVEGGRGLIEVGQEVPYTEQWSAMTGDITGYSEKIAYKTIATGFWVNPVAITGNKVLLEVEPYIGSSDKVANKQAPTINFTQLRTRLLVPLGQWYSLGNQLVQRDEISRAIVSWRSSDGQADRALQIRIEKMD